MVNFTVTRADRATIEKIASRAVELARQAGIHYHKLDAMMDITACHSNGNPLRLADLLQADDFNFGHDILGIRKNIDRNTGELHNSFCPRFTARSRLVQS